VVLKEGQTTEGRWAQTYYVYGINGNLLFIIPPAATSNLTPNQTFVDLWCYQYEYDNYQRQTGSKGPGVGWVYTIYDQWDRPVLTQDANQRAKSPAEWAFIKYDDLNRPIISGIQKTNDSRSTLTTALASFATRYEVRNTSTIAYTINQTFPTTVAEQDLLTINYYDDYGYLSNAGWDAEGNSYSFVPEPGFTGTAFNAVKDLSTGSKVRILGTSTWLNEVAYYDNRYRAIQSLAENHLGKIDRVTTEYDFTDKVLKSKQVHTNATQSIAIQQRHEYDAVGRMLKTYHQINSQPEVLLTSLEYNELGQIIDKKLHSADNGATWLQSLDYRYNIRGWNTNVNNTTVDTGDPVDYFGMELAYNESQSGNAVRFDGMITGNRWKHDLSGKSRVYNYTYDKISFTSASYKVDGAINTQTGIFNETGFTYDLNGNIKSLNRNSGLLTSSLTDQLTYVYGSSGNQLQSVSDATANDLGFKDGNTSGNDYAYDANGNLTIDKNKGIITSSGGAGIIYNFRNLPERVNFNNGDYILYRYDATGTKLSQTYFNSAGVQQSKTDYVDSFVYLNGQLQMFFHGEGRIVAPSNDNLITDASLREANTISGYAAKGNVTISSFAASGQNYVKAVTNDNVVNNGVWPIGNAISVKAGEAYNFRVQGYQTMGNAKLFVWSNSGDLALGQFLPVGASSENWASCTFTVPVGVNQIKLGVLWTSTFSQPPPDPDASNEAYINRIALYRADFEYQYFLTDHQGSPRVVLQTVPNTYTYTATMESENFGTESGQFFNLNSGLEIPLALANATPGGSRAYRMTSNEPVGPVRSFKVLPGDVINVSTVAYYPGGGTFSKNGLTTMATLVANALGGGLPPLIDGIGASYANSTGAANPLFVLSPDQGDAKPSAFLNYILFDETYTPLEAKSVPVGDATGQQKLINLPTISVSQTGILYVYLSYDNVAGGIEVYFDELKIIYQESPVVQINSYYPYGLTAFTWVRDGEQENKYLYQGKELIAQTGWHDFGSRIYWSDLGRWFAVDPQNQFDSPYLAMGNMPMMGVDPDGEFFWLPVILGAIMGGVQGYQIGEANGATGWGMFGYIFGGAAIGGISGAVGGAVTASGAPFSNTLAIFSASTFNSGFMKALSGGKTDINSSFGLFSYNWDRDDVGYLGKEGNSSWENIGYGFGAMANLQDAVSSSSLGKYEYQYEVDKSSSKIGHANIRDATNNNVKISVANLRESAVFVKSTNKFLRVLEYLWKSNFKKYTGGPDYWLDVGEKGFPRIPLTLNSKIVNRMAKNLARGKGLLGIDRTRFGLNFGCASYSARALWYTGVPTIPIINYFGPSVLWGQLALRQAGIYASPYLINH
jgi:RHS repeat-associated protein